MKKIEPPKPEAVIPPAPEQPGWRTIVGTAFDLTKRFPSTKITQAFVPVKNPPVPVVAPLPEKKRTRKKSYPIGGM